MDVVRLDRAADCGRLRLLFRQTAEFWISRPSAPPAFPHPNYRFPLGPGHISDEDQGYFSAGSIGN